MSSDKELKHGAPSLPPENPNNQFYGTTTNVPGSVTVWRNAGGHPQFAIHVTPLISDEELEEQMQRALRAFAEMESRLEAGGHRRTSGAREEIISCLTSEWATASEIGRRCNLSTDTVKGHLATAEGVEIKSKNGGPNRYRLNDAGGTSNDDSPKDRIVRVPNRRLARMNAKARAKRAAEGEVADA
jgi:hypothetical protein